MISIRNTVFSELSNIVSMDNQRHVDCFLSKKSLKTHQKDYRKNDIIYLSVVSAAGLLAGYIILRNQKKSDSVQLKRILIDKSFIGVGQQAILAAEDYCIKKLKSAHIWLDVYEHNSKAIYVYKKLGYVKFKEDMEHSNRVIFYEKKLR